MANKSKIQQINQTYMVSIPKAIAEAMGAEKGREVEFAYAYGEICLRLVR